MINRSRLAVSCLVLCVICMQSVVLGAYYLKIDDIKGETVDKTTYEQCVNHVRNNHLLDGVEGRLRFLIEYSGSRMPRILERIGYMIGQEDLSEKKRCLLITLYARIIMLTSASPNDIIGSKEDRKELGINSHDLSLLHNREELEQPCSLEEDGENVCDHLADKPAPDTSKALMCQCSSPSGGTHTVLCSAGTDGTHMGCTKCCGADQPTDDPGYTK